MCDEFNDNKIGETVCDLVLGAEPNLINGQANCKFSNYSFGCTIVAKSGCAVIATYNALNLKGYMYPFETCLKDYEKLRPSTRFLGVMPYEVGSVLSSHGISHEGYWSIYNLEKDMKNGDVAIVTYWVGAGRAHTVAIQKASGGYTIFNASNNSPQPAYKNSIIDIVGNGYIYGYRLT